LPFLIRNDNESCHPETGVGCARIKDRASDWAGLHATYAFLIDGYSGGLMTIRRETQSLRYKKIADTQEA
jgi:hypothetical protein